MAVTNNATLIEDHETAPSYTSIGSGQGAASDSDFFFLGSAASSRRSDNVTKAGFWFSDGTTHDVSAAGTHVKFYMNFTTNSLLTDFWLRLGNSSTVYEEHAVTAAFYPTGSGGWIPVWVEVDAGTDTGSPTFTAIDFFAVLCSMGDISSNLKNMVTDQCHYSTRPVMLWDGSSGDLDDFITTEDTNGLGVLTKQNGTFTCYANLEIGSATLTTFDASGQTIAFPDATWLPSASTWMGIDVTLSNASSDIDFSSATILSGNPSGATARKPDFLVSGTTGSLDLTGATLNGMRLVDLNSAVTATNIVIRNSGIVDAAESGTTGCDMSGGSILTSSVAADEGALFWDVNEDPDTKTDGMTFSQGTNAHHAIRFGTSVPADITLRNCEFTGFSGTDDVNGSTFRFDDTSGTITLNLVGCTVGGAAASSGNIGIDDAAGVTVNLVIDPVTTQFTVQDNAGTALQNARVLAETADNGGGSGFPFEDSVSITQTGGTATVTHTGHGLATNDYVVIRGAQADGYNKAAQITVSDANTYTYSVDSGLASPATGSPVASYAPIVGLTDVSGQISSSKTWPASQGLKGWARLKNTSSPFYRDANITVADASGGTDATLVLQPDE